MRNASTIILRWVSLLMIFAAVLLTVFELITYSRIRTTFPPGLMIAGVPAGGLDQQETADRLTQAYGVPIELHYGDAIVQVKPSVVGFELRLQGMLAAADLQRINQPFWSAFWDFLWGRLPTPAEVPLSASISDERLRVFLKDEISQRYDRPAAPPVPIPGTVKFENGFPGSNLDIDRAVVLIDDALRSPSSRVVNLSVREVGSPRPTLNHLEILLKQTVDLSGFDGVIELYMLDLQTNQELHFAYQKGTELTPDIAFTAASTMKIPIMVSVMSRVPEPVPQSIADQLVLMIERSENDPADRMMETVMDQTLGPLKVTEDLKAMGFANTFLAGYFYQGAPLLARINTPANQRTDISTSPDSYNQTTPLEIGELLFDIYQCSENGGGTLAAVFPGKVTQIKCQSMINYLEGNRIGVLMQSGLPEGTKIANKHGWITESDGLLHTIGDAGIIFTPGGNYILSIYMNNRKQLLFDPANNLVSTLTRATYNYFNLENQ